jgi:hypothetical protein
VMVPPLALDDRSHDRQAQAAASGAAAREIAL